MKCGFLIVYVSHAVAEIARLATTVVVVANGRVEAVGPVSHVLTRISTFGNRAGGGWHRHRAGRRTRCGGRTDRSHFKGRHHNCAPCCRGDRHGTPYLRSRQGHHACVGTATRIERSQCSSRAHRRDRSVRRPDRRGDARPRRRAPACADYAALTRGDGPQPR